MITFSDLRGFNIFSDWTDDELVFITQYLEEENMQKNQTLFEQNNPANRMYFIKSGCIELKFSTETNNMARLARLKSGDTLGEMSIIDDLPRSAAAVAFVDTTLISITKDKFYRFINECGKETAVKLLINLAKSLSSKLRAIDGEIRHLNLYT